MANATMRRMNYAVLLVAAMIAAQAGPPEVEITAEPHHHLTMENKSVRVFNVQVDPNTETLTHRHRHDYISITLGQAEITNSVQGKVPVDVKFQDGDTRFSPAPFAHFVRCTSSQPFRNVTIEILQDGSLRNTKSPWNPEQNEDRALNTFDGGTQQIFFVRDAIRASEIELQPGATAPKRLHRGPELLVALNDLDLRNSEAKNSKSEHFKTGESKWFESRDSRVLSNAGTSPARFVTLEFP
ncbi:MAG TPA: hypothetical protein VGG14_19465 [Candidatus Sulfotelmatobacter sp.]